MTPPREVRSRLCAWCGRALPPGVGPELYVVDEFGKRHRSLSHGLCEPCELDVELELELEDEDDAEGPDHA